MTDQLLQSNITLLIVDDSESDRLTYSRYLRSDSERSYRIIEAETLEEGLELWRSQQPDVVLLDLNLPDGDGLEFLANVEHEGTPIPVIMLTGQGNEKTAVNAMKLGANDYLVKGDITATSLAAAVNRVLRETELSRQLLRSQQQQILIAEIALRIREFTDLDDISNAIVKEVRQFINVDRTAIYKFNPDMSGNMIAEDIIPPWQPCLNMQVSDNCFLENLGGAYCEGRIFVANDIYAANLTDCHIKLLERFQVRANLVVPILLPNDNQRILWGLLILHQCSAPRIWIESDIQLLQQLAVQLAIAINQAIAYQQVQNELVERERAERALQQLNQSLEEKVQERTQEIQLQAQMLEQIHDAVVSTTLDGTIVTWNIGAERLYEYAAHEAIGQKVSMLYLSEDLPFMQSTVFIPLLEKGTHEVELRNRTKSGNIIDIDLRLSVVRDAMGNSIRLIGCSNNISDRKQVENALRESQTLFQTVLDAFPLAIFWKDRQSLYFGCNQLFATISGAKSPSEVIGKSNFDFSYTEEEALAYLADDRQVMESGLAKLNIEETITLPSGEQQWIQTNKIPLRDSEGNVIGVMGTFQDISDRKQAEEALRASDKRWKLALESAGDGAWDWDVKNKEVFYSPQWKSLLGYADDEIENRFEVWENLVHPDDLAQCYENINKCLNNEVLLYESEHRLRCKDGSYKWILSRGKVIEWDANGHALRMMGTHTDLSDRKQAELQLQNATDRLALALNSGAIGCWELNLANNTIVWDERAYELHGIPLGTDITSDIWASSLHPDDIQSTQALVNRAIAGEAEFDTEYRVIHPDRSIHFIKGYGVIVRDIDGNPLRMIGINFDISDRKRSEVALLNSERRYQALFNHKSDAVFVSGFTETEKPSRFIEVNDTACDSLGYSRAELLTMTPSEIMPKDFFCKREVMETLRSQKYASQEILHQTKDGRIFPVELNMSEHETVEGTPLVIAFARDISDRKQAEAQLQKINNELLRATRLKDEFLANMSHELRTPLNSILGLSESLKDGILGSLNAKQLKAIATVESSGEHLLSLINDILDLSKISAGMLELDIASVSVRNLCDSSLVFVKQQAFQKSVQIDSNIPARINNINIDERRIKQVLINLLTNSVKFTPSGGKVNLLVAIGSGDTWQGEATIPQRFRDINSPTILFQVIDTGIGISDKDLKMLFQPFVQVDSALNRQYEGTGLGLALVKQIVELHGGQVMVESEVGQGSRFTFALPYEMSASNAIASTPTSTTSSSLEIDPDNAPLILLAEDNEANIQTFSSYLTAINYRVIIARNGIEAIAQAKENLPDIILMDVQMPIMDGLEATKQIRLAPNLINIPIIALTALAMEGDREKCLAAGANEYLSKPVKLRQLATKIAELLSPPARY